MKSTILLCIKKETELQGQNIFTEEYITDLYVYTKMPNLCLFFRKDSNKLYSINRDQERLLEVQKSDQEIAQIAQLKSMLTMIDVSQAEAGENKKYIVKGTGELISLDAEIKTSSMQEFEQTANYENFQLSQKTALFELNLSKNEFVENSSLQLKVHGNKVETKTIVKEINIMKGDVTRYDHIYKYQY